MAPNRFRVADACLSCRLPARRLPMDTCPPARPPQLITNSDFHYTREMMSYAYDCFLPEGQTWRDLFDMIIVNARKVCCALLWCCGEGGGGGQPAGWRTHPSGRGTLTSTIPHSLPSLDTPCSLTSSHTPTASTR